jgi:DNA invertase Pin-like site-specific DNA recombinase
MKNSQIYLRTALVYVRAYSKESLNIYGLAEQEKAITDFALKQGYRILEIFREQNLSARTFNRPAFRELMEYLKSHRWKVKFILVSDFTRLSTNKEELKRLRSFLRLEGIKVISVVGSMLRNSGKQPKQHL